MKKRYSNIALVIVFLPIFFALSGLSVIRHDCSLCRHSDIDIFSADNCCNESHDLMECCHSSNGIHEELHKCQHKVYMFSAPTTLSFSGFHIFAEPVIKNISSIVYIVPLVSGVVNDGMYYPPPAYISNCILRT